MSTPASATHEIRGCEQLVVLYSVTSLMYLAIAIESTTMPTSDPYYFYTACIWAVLSMLHFAYAIHHARSRVLWDDASVRSYDWLHHFELPWNRMSRAYHVEIEPRWGSPKNRRIYHLIDEAGGKHYVGGDDAADEFRTFLDNYLLTNRLPTMRELYEQGMPLDFDALNLQKQLGLTHRRGIRAGERIAWEVIASYRVEKNALRIFDATNEELERIPTKRIANLPILLALLYETRSRDIAQP